MSYLNELDKLSDSDYLKKTEVAIGKAAKNVLAETFTQADFLVKRQRKILANKIHASPKNYVDRFLRAILLRGDFPENPTDQNFQDFVDAEWNKVAEMDNNNIPINLL